MTSSPPTPRLILASQSASRRAMLDAAGVAYQAVPAHVDEEAAKESLRAGGADPRALADALAELKALKVSQANPGALVLVQALDGIAASCIGILVPLVASDIAGHSGRYNLSLGFIGLAIGVGATISTSLAGWIADTFGARAAFASLAAVGLAAVILALCAMPETSTAGNASPADGR